MSPGLEPDKLVSLLEEDLKPWVAEHKGILSVAADPWNLIELLAEKPVGWRGVLHFDGDSPRANHHSEGCIVDARFSFGITCARGLTIRPEERLHKPGPNSSPALLRLVSMARIRIRSFAFPDGVSDRFVSYAGCDPVVLPDGTPLMAYKLNFTLICVPETVTAYRNL